MKSDGKRSAFLFTQSFVREALAADADIERTGEVYRAEDVHAWLQRLARGPKARRPKPWRR